MPLTTAQENICAAFANTCASVGAAQSPALTGIQIGTRIASLLGPMTIPEAQALVNFADRLNLFAAYFSTNPGPFADRYARATVNTMAIVLTDEQAKDLYAQIARAPDEATRQALGAQLTTILTTRQDYVNNLLSIVNNG